MKKCSLIIHIFALTSLSLAVWQDILSHMNLVVWPCSPWVLHSSVVRASNWHLEGHGFDSRWGAQNLFLSISTWERFFINMKGVGLGNMIGLILFSLRIVWRNYLIPAFQKHPPQLNSLICRHYCNKHPYFIKCPYSNVKVPLELHVPSSTAGFKKPP